MKRICRECRGTGNGRDLKSRGCTACNGSGRVGFDMEAIDTNDVRPGDRIGAGHGICTVRGIKIDCEHITFYWEEPQAPMTQHRSNCVERVIG